MDCKAFRRESEELETGESLSRTAQAHVDTCAACRTFQAERLSLRQLVGQLGAVNAPPDFDFQLRARLAAAKSASTQPFHRTLFAPGLRAISVAAVFVLLIAGAIVFRQFQAGQSPQRTTAEKTSSAKSNDAPSQKQADEPQQLASVLQSGDAQAKGSAPSAPTTDGVSYPKGGVEKIAQVKHTRNAPAVQTNRSPLITTDMAFGGNPPVITPVRPSATNAAGDGEAATTALLRVSSQPFKVVLHDRQGALRSVSLEPVVFGSQDFLGRAAQRHPAASNVEGIW